MTTEKQNRGFTLLELLVAMAIFSLMSMMVYSSLTSMTETRELLQKRTESFAKVQTFFRVIGRDVIQIADRPVRDGFGSEDPLPAVSKEIGQSGFEFTRNGWRNPAGRPRSSLQRVRYQLKEGRLVRENWQVLDRDIDSTPYENVLLDKVWELDISFVGPRDKIYKEWPPVSNNQPGSVDWLPKAVLIQIEVESWGKFDRLILVNNGDGKN